MGQLEELIARKYTARQRSMLPLLVRTQIYRKTYANGLVFYVAKAVLRHQVTFLGLNIYKFNLEYSVCARLDSYSLCSDGDYFSPPYEFPSKGVAIEALEYSIFKQYDEWLAEEIVSFENDEQYE